MVAEVLPAAAAIFAHPAGPAEPRHADPVADLETIDIGARLDDGADDLVAGDQRQFRLGQLAVDDMQIGAADPAGMNLDQQLPRTRPRRRHIGGGELVSHGGQQLRAHRIHPATAQRDASAPISAFVSVCAAAGMKPSAGPTATCRSTAAATASSGIARSCSEP